MGKLTRIKNFKELEVETNSLRRIIGANNKLTYIYSRDEVSGASDDDIDHDDQQQ
jgi:hypothetical protein